MDKIINLDRMRIYHSDSDLGVLIFTGIGGSVEGYNGKYTKIAENLVNMYNASVFIIAVESWNEFDSLFNATMDLVKSYYKELSVPDYKIYAMGTSAGASMVVAQSYKHDVIKRVLSINPVIYSL